MNEQYTHTLHDIRRERRQDCPRPDSCQESLPTLEVPSTIRLPTTQANDAMLDHNDQPTQPKSTFPFSGFSPSSFSYSSPNLFISGSPIRFGISAVPNPPLPGFQIKSSPRNVTKCGKEKFNSTPSIPNDYDSCHVGHKCAPDPKSGTKMDDKADFGLLDEPQVRRRDHLTHFASNFSRNASPTFYSSAPSTPSTRLLHQGWERTQGVVEQSFSSGFVPQTRVIHPHAKTRVSHSHDVGPRTQKSPGNQPRGDGLQDSQGSRSTNPVCSSNLNSNFTQFSLQKFVPSPQSELLSSNLTQTEFLSSNKNSPTHSNSASTRTSRDPNGCSHSTINSCFIQTNQGFSPSDENSQSFSNVPNAEASRDHNGFTYLTTNSTLDTQSNLKQLNLPPGFSRATPEISDELTKLLAATPHKAGIKPNVVMLGAVPQLDMNKAAALATQLQKLSRRQNARSNQTESTHSFNTHTTKSDAPKMVTRATSPLKFTHIQLTGPETKQTSRTKNNQSTSRASTCFASGLSQANLPNQGSTKSKTPTRKSRESANNNASRYPSVVAQVQGNLNEDQAVEFLCEIKSPCPNQQPQTQARPSKNATKAKSKVQNGGKKASRTKLFETKPTSTTQTFLNESSFNSQNVSPRRRVTNPETLRRIRDWDPQISPRLLADPHETPVFSEKKTSIKSEPDTSLLAHQDSKAYDPSSCLGKTNQSPQIPVIDLDDSDSDKMLLQMFDDLERSQQNSDDTTYFEIPQTEPTQVDVANPQVEPSVTTTTTDTESDRWADTSALEASRATMKKFRKQNKSNLHKFDLSRLGTDCYSADKTLVERKRAPIGAPLAESTPNSEIIPGTQTDDNPRPQIPFSLTTFSNETDVSTTNQAVMSDFTDKTTLPNQYYVACNQGESSTNPQSHLPGDLQQVTTPKERPVEKSADETSDVPMEAQSFGSSWERKQYFEFQIKPMLDLDLSTLPQSHDVSETPQIRKPTGHRSGNPLRAASRGGSTSRYNLRRTQAVANTTDYVNTSMELTDASIEDTNSGTKPSKPSRVHDFWGDQTTKSGKPRKPKPPKLQPFVFDAHKDTPAMAGQVPHLIVEDTTIEPGSGTDTAGSTKRKIEHKSPPSTKRKKANTSGTRRNSSGAASWIQKLRKATHQEHKVLETVTLMTRRHRQMAEQLPADIKTDQQVATEIQNLVTQTELTWTTMQQYKEVVSQFNVTKTSSESEPEHDHEDSDYDRVQISSLQTPNIPSAHEHNANSESQTTHLNNPQPLDLTDVEGVLEGDSDQGYTATVTNLALPKMCPLLHEDAAAQEAAAKAAKATADALNLDPNNTVPPPTNGDDDGVHKTDDDEDDPQSPNGDHNNTGSQRDEDANSNADFDVTRTTTRHKKKKDKPSNTQVGGPATGTRSKTGSNVPTTSSTLPITDLVRNTPLTMLDTQEITEGQRRMSTQMSNRVITFTQNLTQKGLAARLPASFMPHLQELIQLRQYADADVSMDNMTVAIELAAEQERTLGQRYIRNSIITTIPEGSRTQDINSLMTDGQRRQTQFLENKMQSDNKTQGQINTIDEILSRRHKGMTYPGTNTTDPMGNRFNQVPGGQTQQNQQPQAGTPHTNDGVADANQDDLHNPPPNGNPGGNDDPDPPGGGGGGRGPQRNNDTDDDDDVINPNPFINDDIDAPNVDAVTALARAVVQLSTNQRNNYDNDRAQRPLPPEKVAASLRTLTLEGRTGWAGKPSDCRFSEFLGRYIEASKLMNLNDEQRAFYLRYLLSDEPYERYNACTPAVITNFEQVVAILKACFEKEFNLHEYRRDLRDVRQTRQEDVMQYFNRVLHSAAPLYRQIPEEHRDSLIMQHFIDGLRKPIITEVLKADPQTLEEARAKAIRFEQIMRTTDQFNGDTPSRDLNSNPRRLFGPNQNKLPQRNVPGQPGRTESQCHQCYAPTGQHYRMCPLNKSTQPYRQDRDTRGRNPQDPRRSRDNGFRRNNSSYSNSNRRNSNQGSSNSFPRNQNQGNSNSYSRNQNSFQGSRDNPGRFQRNFQSGQSRGNSNQFQRRDNNGQSRPQFPNRFNNNASRPPISNESRRPDNRTPGNPGQRPFGQNNFNKSRDNGNNRSDQNRSSPRNNDSRNTNTRNPDSRNQDSRNSNFRDRGRPQRAHAAQINETPIEEEDEYTFENENLEEYDQYDRDEPQDASGDEDPDRDQSGLQDVWDEMDRYDAHGCLLVNEEDSDDVENERDSDDYTSDYTMSPLTFGDDEFADQNQPPDSLIHHAIQFHSKSKETVKQQIKMAQRGMQVGHRIDLVCKGIHIKALHDTGASVNVLTPATLRILECAKVIKKEDLHKVTATLKTYCGTMQSLTGMVEIPTSSGAHGPINLVFFTHKEARMNTLGLPGITELFGKVVPNTAKTVLSPKKGEPKPKYNTAKGLYIPQPCKINSAVTQTIPPFSTQRVEAQVVASEAWVDIDSVQDYEELIDFDPNGLVQHMEPVAYTQDKAQISILEAIYDVEDKSVPVTIDNYTDAEITINQGQILGNLTPAYIDPVTRGDTCTLAQIQRANSMQNTQDRGTVSQYNRELHKAQQEQERSDETQPDREQDVEIMWEHDPPTEAYLYENRRHVLAQGGAPEHSSNMPVIKKREHTKMKLHYTAEEIRERNQIIREMFSNRLDHLTITDRDRVIQFLLAHHSAFKLKDEDIGCVSSVKYHMDTGDAQPIKQQVRRLPISKRPEIEKQLNKLLELGLIVRSRSPWASPIVPVTKPNGEIRLCIDYRKVNALTKVEAFPLPRCSDIIDVLGKIKPKWFTTLDCTSGYWQLPMNEGDQEKTAFTTHMGLFEWTRMPFGVVNAPGVFQRLMQEILHGIDDDRISVYIDDILIVSNTISEHFELLRKVFHKLHYVGLRLGPKKCEFLQPKVNYLGYVISAEGLQTNPDKVAAVEKYPIPHNLKELRRFLGMTGWCRRFMPKYSIVASPLYVLTRKDRDYDWCHKCQNAFEKLRDLMSSSEVLVYPDFTKPFVLETDGSGVGIGGVLLQEDDKKKLRPIAYASRTLRDAETRYMATELECLAIIWCLNEFRVYVLGHELLVVTDHNALKNVMTTKIQNARINRWSLLLAEYNPKITYRKGSLNGVADALSRIPSCQKFLDIVPKCDLVTPDKLLENAMVNHINTEFPVCTQDVVGYQLALDFQPYSYEICRLQSQGSSRRDAKGATNTLRPEEKLRDEVLWTQIAKAQKEDTFLAEIHRHLVKPDEPWAISHTEDWYNKNREQIVLDTKTDVVLWIDVKDKHHKLIVPEAHRQLLIQAAHDGSAHFALKRAHQKLTTHYWWPKLWAQVKDHIEACIVCAARAGQSLKGVPVGSPIPIVPRPFYKVCMDFVKVGKTSENADTVLVIIDLFTKWPEVYIMRDLTAKELVRHWIDYICRWGPPREVITDNGKQFRSEIFRTTCEFYGTQTCYTTHYHAQSDPTERYHQWLLDGLAKVTGTVKKDWDLQIDQVLFAYRTTIHAATGMSPWFMVRGTDPPFIADSIFARVDLQHLNENNDHVTHLYDILSWAHAEATQRLKNVETVRTDYYNRKRPRDPKIEAGMRVWHYNKGRKKGDHHKLQLCFQGPYRCTYVSQKGVARLRQVNNPSKQVEPVNICDLTICNAKFPDNVFYSGTRVLKFTPNEMSGTQKLDVIPKQFQYKSSAPEKATPESLLHQLGLVEYDPCVTSRFVCEF